MISARSSSAMSESRSFPSVGREVLVQYSRALLHDTRAIALGQ